MIYLDVLLLVNFLIAYLFLLAAGTLSQQRASFGRMILGSSFAALSALILLAPELSYPWQFGYKVVTAILIIAITYGVKRIRRFLAAACWYAALNILLAGACLLTVLNTNTQLLQTANLTIYLRISPILLVATCGLCCTVIEAGTRILNSKKDCLQTVGLEFDLCGTRLHIRAALDTGCHLRDPITCLPVLVISFPDSTPRLPANVCAFLKDWFQGKTESNPPDGTQLRLIPCHTVSSGSLLPGFAVGNIRLITDKGVLELGRSAVAFAPNSFNSNLYEALYGSDFL